MAVTQVIRDKFFSGYREAEFIVVCDVCKETSKVVKELNDAQVNLCNVIQNIIKYLAQFCYFHNIIFHS